MKLFYRVISLFISIFILVACSTTSFRNNNGQYLTYQGVVKNSNTDSLYGREMIVGGGILSYQYNNGNTQIEVANSELTARGFPSGFGNPSERVIVIIPGEISSDRIQNGRLTAVGTIQEISSIQTYRSDAMVIMINAKEYQFWRQGTAGRAREQQKYGFTYTFGE